MLGSEPAPNVRVHRLLREDAVSTTWAVRGANGEDLELRAPVEPSAEAAARFREVAGALVGLAHPNVVNVTQVLEINGKPAAITERAAGRTLRAWLSAGPPSAHEVVGVLVRVLRGVAALHRAGVVHGALDTGRIVLPPGAEHQQPRVADAVLGHRLQVPSDGRADLVAVGRILTEMAAAVPTRPVALADLAAALIFGDERLRTADLVLEHLQDEPALLALLPPSAKRTRLHRSGPTLLPTEELPSLAPGPRLAPTPVPPRPRARNGFVAAFAVAVLGILAVGLVIGAPIVALVLWGLLA